ncbi:MAG: hypothetical protein QMD44_05650 [Thermodesulfovibrionales bacterium]|jgi:hypothetical protein|nr:hypothetical protein [Thermodesulfovibrionales bacterium]
MNKYPPECPFCGRHIVRPETTCTEFGEILSGRCNCGAVYVCDPTGHNSGEAYMEAMAMAKGDWDIGMMDEDMDYQTEDMDYDLKNHMRLYSAGMGETRGKLVFVKLKMPDARQSQPAEIPSKTTSVSEDRGKKGDMKERIKDALSARSYDKITDMARRDKGVIRRLISLAYDKDDVMGWRAIEAMGYVAGELSKQRVDIVRDTIRRLLWSMGEESGGIGWSAAEMIGEIVRSNPDQFTDVVPIVWSFHEEEMFRPGTVWAMGRIASVRPDLVKFILKDIQGMITDKNPAVRGYAAWVIGILREDGFLEDINKLTSDNSTVNFYQEGELTRKTVAEIVKAAINKITHK